MKKMIFVFLPGLIFILGQAQVSYSMSCHGGGSQMSQVSESTHSHSDQADATTQATQAVKPQEGIDVGNKICPVSGEKIDEKMKATYEYNGKIYNFCCASCIDEFKKDPEKYIKKVVEELQSEGKGQSGHEEHDMEMMQESGTKAR